MQKVSTYRPTKSVTLRRGWVNPETLDAHRVVVVRQQVIGDELAAERALREMGRAPAGSHEKLFSESATAESVLTLARCIESWEGIAAPNWQHVELLTRADYLALRAAINDLDDEGVVVVDKIAGDNHPK